MTGKAIKAKTKLFINKYRLYVPGEPLSSFSASANFPFFPRVTSPRASMACTDSTVGESSILPSTSSFSNLSAIESLANVFFAHSFTSAIDHSVKKRNKMS